MLVTALRSVILVEQVSGVLDDCKDNVGRASVTQRATEWILCVINGTGIASHHCFCACMQLLCVVCAALMQEMGDTGECCMIVDYS